MNVYKPLVPTQTPNRRNRRTSGYGCWVSMKSRCLNPKEESYRRYGGRGISIYPPWISSFSTFLEYMGTRPSLLHTIGRKNNDGNYEPGNVEWQLEEPQQNNKSDTILIEHNGQRLSLKQWSKVIGISHTAMRERYLKGGDPSVILGPVRGAKRTGRARLLSLGKDTRSVQAWAKVIGISAPSLRKRIDELGWTVERALTQPKRKQ